MLFLVPLDCLQGSRDYKEQRELSENITNIHYKMTTQKRKLSQFESIHLLQK